MTNYGHPAGTMEKPVRKLMEFIDTYADYRAGGHGRLYSARIAFGVAFQGKPF